MFVRVGLNPLAVRGSSPPSRHDHLNPFVGTRCLKKFLSLSLSLSLVQYSQLIRFMLTPIHRSLVTLVRPAISTSTVARRTMSSGASIQAQLSEGSITILASVSEYRAWRRRAYEAKKSVGFVATMGALHEGHASLGACIIFLIPYTMSNTLATRRFCSAQVSSIQRLDRRLHLRQPSPVRAS